MNDKILGNRAEKDTHATEFVLNTFTVSVLDSTETETVEKKKTSGQQVASVDDASEASPELVNFFEKEETPKTISRKKETYLGMDGMEDPKMLDLLAELAALDTALPSSSAPDLSDLELPYFEGAPQGQSPSLPYLNVNPSLPGLAYAFRENGIQPNLNFSRQEQAPGFQLKAEPVQAPRLLPKTENEVRLNHTPLREEPSRAKSEKSIETLADRNRVFAERDNLIRNLARLDLRTEIKGDYPRESKTTVSVPSHAPKSPLEQAQDVMRTQLIPEKESRQSIILLHRSANDKDLQALALVSGPGSATGYNSDGGGGNGRNQYQPQPEDIAFTIEQTDSKD